MFYFSRPNSNTKNKNILKKNQIYQNKKTSVGSQLLLQLLAQKKYKSDRTQTTPTKNLPGASVGEKIPVPLCLPHCTHYFNKPCCNLKLTPPVTASGTHR